MRVIKMKQNHLTVNFITLIKDYRNQFKCINYVSLCGLF